MKWEEGSKILNNSPMSFHQYDLTTLCKLLTMIIRADRFNDGFLIMNFNDGTIFKIVAAIQGKVL